MTRILLTGASGFLGLKLAARFAQADVECISCSLSGRNGVVCDLTDSHSVRLLIRDVQPSVVVHCAAEVPKAIADYSNGATSRASVAMMQALASATTARIVFTSSMTVYEPPLLLPVSEVNVPMPSAAYAAGKWRAEEILMQRRRNGDVALRLPGLFGVERRSGLLFNAIRAFLKGSLFQLSSPPDLWAAMNVDDAAHYVAQAALSDKQHPSEAVNVGYPGTFSIPGVIRKIASLCGTEWAYDGTNGPEFSANLERLRERYGLLSVTFDDRLRELIESVRAELRQA